MNDERRDRWNCCHIFHGGEGPETSPWTDILGVNPITAREAAECYAEERMGGPLDDDEYGDGDCMRVAVQVSEGKSRWFVCQKLLAVRLCIDDRGEEGV
jgi:hypothetical protein